MFDLRTLNASDVLKAMVDKNVPIKDAIIVHDSVRNGSCKLRHVRKIQKVIDKISLGANLS